jgi:uncharacterized membrane protein YqgA involved in biofilm formation
MWSMPLRLLSERLVATQRLLPIYSPTVHLKKILSNFFSNFKNRLIDYQYVIFKPAPFLLKDWTGMTHLTFFQLVILHILKFSVQRYSKLLLFSLIVIKNLHEPAIFSNIVLSKKRNMIGTLVNAGAIIVGGSIGLLLKKNLPEKYQTIYFQAVGLFTLLYGITMAIAMSSPLLVILSLVIGGFLGARMQLEKRMEQLGDYVQLKIRIKNDRFTEGLVTSFLLFCIGSMTILGAIEEGFGKTSNILLTKSILDFFSSIMLASGLGTGVLFSAIPLLLFQGGITLLVSIVGKDIPPQIVSELTVVGGILLIGLSFNLLKIKKIEIVNLLPSLLFICIFIWLQLRFF